MVQDQALRIIVIDDDAGVRDSLSALVSAKGFDCETFADAESFLACSDAGDPAVILMDHSLKAVSGLDAIRRLRGDGDSRPIIMITAHGDLDLAVEAMKAGASDYIEKPWDRDALFEAISRVTARARSAADLANARRAAADAIASFTPREREVFEELVNGASNKQVARALDLSPRTVEFYRANVFEKAGVSGIAELVRLAYLARGAEI